MTAPLASYEAAARAVCDRAGDELHVASAMYPSQPDGLLRAIVAETARRDLPLTLMVADLSGRFTFLDEVPPDHVRLVTMGGRVPARLAAHVDHLPWSLWEIARRLRDGARRVDVFVVEVASPGGDGRCSFGPMVSYSPAAVAGAAATVAEINYGLPTVPGCAGPRLDDLDVVLDTGNASYPELAARAPRNEERRIGRHLADIIPDGATLQLGIGGIPEGFAAALVGRKRLGLHSGALPEGVIPLIEAGVFTGEDKEFDQRRHVTTSLLGTVRLYDYAADPAHGIELRPVEETHDPRALLRLRRLFAINSCFEVDLSGQVNAEYADGRKASSMGGQADFGKWAHHSEDGGNVIALTSRTRSGRSRIVAGLAPPGRVTTHRTDVDFVVTEHGVAALRGKSADERARALVAVAHPDDRAALRAAWED